MAENFLNRMFGSFSEMGFNEYVKFVKRENLPLEIATRAFFNDLDVDQNGWLSRREAIPLYKISINKLRSCGVCRYWYADSFFCNFTDAFDLCRNCYARGSSRRNGGHIFRENQYLQLAQPSRQIRKSELQLTAEAYYQNVSPNVKLEACKFFMAMDKNGNNKIDIYEYISRMKQLGYQKLANPKLFMELNGNGSGQLEFMEVMTLYYIIQSRRTFCDACNTFMAGIFFTCNDCFNSEYDKTFDVCIRCFKTKNYRHQHNHFIDNYTLLESKRIGALMQKKRQRRNETNRYNPCTTIVPYNCPQKFNVWLTLFASAAIILSDCSIM